MTVLFPIFGTRARVRIESQLAPTPSHGKDGGKKREMKGERGGDWNPGFLGTGLLRSSLLLLLLFPGCRLGSVVREKQEQTMFKVERRQLTTGTEMHNYIRPQIVI